jgi:phosphoglycolate phosphatase
MLRDPSLRKGHIPRVASLMRARPAASVGNLEQLLALILPDREVDSYASLGQPNVEQQTMMDERPLRRPDEGRPLPPARALAFDLDGTLIDSRRDIAAACNHVLSHAGRSALDEAIIATFVGDGARALLARAFGFERTAPELDELHDEFVRYYAAHPITHTGWMSGAVAALDALGAHPLAILTNKTRTVTLAILDALGARARFAAIYGAGDGPLKPSPEPVLSIARAVGVAPQELWVIGDAAQDVGAGRAAGSPTIGVLGGFHSEARLREAGPDRVIASLAELPALVAQASAV